MCEPQTLNCETLSYEKGHGLIGKTSLNSPVSHLSCEFHVNQLMNSDPKLGFERKRSQNIS